MNSTTGKIVTVIFTIIDLILMFFVLRLIGYEENWGAGLAVFAVAWVIAAFFVWTPYKRIKDESGVKLFEKPSYYLKELKHPCTIIMGVIFILPALIVLVFVYYLTSNGGKKKSSSSSSSSGTSSSSNSDDNRGLIYGDDVVQKKVECCANCIHYNNGVVPAKKYNAGGATYTIESHFKAPCSAGHRNSGTTNGDFPIHFRCNDFCSRW